MHKNIYEYVIIYVTDKIFHCPIFIIQIPQKDCICLNMAVAAKFVLYDALSAIAL